MKYLNPAGYVSQLVQVVSITPLNKKVEIKMGSVIPSKFTSQYVASELFIKGYGPSGTSAVSTIDTPQNLQDLTLAQLFVLLESC